VRRVRRRHKGLLPARVLPLRMDWRQHREPQRRKDWIPRDLLRSKDWPQSTGLSPLPQVLRQRMGWQLHKD